MNLEDVDDVINIVMLLFVAWFVIPPLLIAVMVWARNLKTKYFRKDGQ